MGCAEDSGITFDWSRGLRIQPLIDLSSNKDSKVARQMVCTSLESSRVTYKFNLNVIPMANSEGKDLLLSEKGIDVVNIF